MIKLLAECLTSQTLPFKLQFSNTGENTLNITRDLHPGGELKLNEMLFLFGDSALM